VLKRLLGNEFVRNVAKLVSGTTVAQAVPFLVLPLITRLYGPDDFASLEQYMMLVEILIIPATMKYEFAIMHPDRDDDAKQLLYFVILFCFSVSLLYTLFGFLMAPIAAEVFDNPDALIFIPLVGLGVFLLGVHLSFNYWYSRKKRYGLLGSTKVVETAVGEASKIGYWYGGWANLGLVYGFITGRIAMVITYLVRFRRSAGEVLFRLRKKRLRELLKEHVNYPKYIMFSSIVGRSTAWMHIFLFSVYFEPVVGLIALARRLAYAPLSIISLSFSQVFYQKISEVKDPKELLRIHSSALRPLVLFGLAIIAVVMLLPENTFAVIFSEEWGVAQPYIEVLIFWFVANFISTCFSFIFLRLKKQKQMLRLDILHFVLVLVSIYSGILWDLGAMTTLVIFSVVQTAFSIFMVVLGRTYLKEFANRQIPEE